MDSQASLPILYSFRRCPYAMRARLALRASGIAVEHREVKLSAKPAQMLTASPKGTVPVLVVAPDQVIDESLDIMRWALAQSDPQHWLPPDEPSRKASDKLIAECDGPFKHALDRYKYPSRYPGSNPEEHRQNGAAFINLLDQHLADRPFLLSDSPGISDMAVAPFVRQFAMTDRSWFDAQPFRRAIAWLDRFLESPDFQAIMHKFPLWQADQP